MKRPSENHTDFTATLRALAVSEDGDRVEEDGKVGRRTTNRASGPGKPNWENSSAAVGRKSSSKKPMVCGKFSCL